MNVLNNSDRTIVISTAKKRTSKVWKNQTITWGEMVERLTTTKRRTDTTFSEYQRLSAQAKSDIKDVGGFVGGALKAKSRKTENVQNRSIIALDADFLSESVEDFWDCFVIMNGYECVAYTTHSHSPEAPRLRLVIPTNRAMFPDEYAAVSRKIAEDLGMEMFDETTFESARMMFWPSTSADGEFIAKHQVGKFLDVDKTLARYTDWRDTSEWPMHNNEQKHFDILRRRQEDPLEKKGPIGLFCRTYTIQEVIDKYLSDVYTPAKAIAGTEGNISRYTYSDGSGYGGLVVYEDKFAYSHHGSDPISGMLVNAFDLVRIHLYGGLDYNKDPNSKPTSMPSYKKMAQVVVQDESVKLTKYNESRSEVETEFEFEDEVDDSWKTQLSINDLGQTENSINNCLLVLRNDPRIKNKLQYDAFANRAIVRSGVPWRKVNEDTTWSDVDDAGLRYFFEQAPYGVNNKRNIDDARILVFEESSFHPVVEWLENLPPWDGVKRLESLFVDYLGASDNVYTRNIAQIHIVAAIRRVMFPGYKYDNMVTFTGDQGLGKSTFIKNLAAGWFSDSQETIQGKAAIELLQGNWHIELAELFATKKSDRDAVKRFLSKDEDIMRVPYATYTSTFKRQCVFWGSTNDYESLRDPTGDRRAYPIDCGDHMPTKAIFDDKILHDQTTEVDICLSEEVEQIYAEAMVLHKQGFKTRITDRRVTEIWNRELMAHKEVHPMQPLVIKFLEMKFPRGYEDLSTRDRIAYVNQEELADEDPLTATDQYEPLDKVCSAQIWTEVLGNDKGKLDYLNARIINEVLMGLPGWRRMKGPRRFKNYGSQRGYERCDNC